jgi:tRNA(fMet)-specific endonuclease VapC
LGVLIDTSVIVQIERSGQTPARIFEHIGERIALLAAISVSELLHGVHRADDELRRQRRKRFLDSVFEVLPILAFDFAAAERHAQLSVELKRRGELIGANDLLIASSALAGGHAVVTANVREFRRVEKLEIILWDAV